MRRILFVNATDPVSETENRYRPLWPAYLSAYAEKTVGRGQLDFRFATEEVGKELNRYRPDLVAIGAVTQNFDYAVEYARVCKSQGLPVVVGGPHISLLPETISESMDVGCIGEGEKTFTELLELFLDKGELKRKELLKINGLVFRENGTIVRTCPRDLIRKLDDIPHPMRTVIGYDRDSYIVSSRGCPYKCAYCASSQFWCNYRFASAKYTVEEVDELVGHGSRIIRFNDDLFAVNQLRLKKMIELLSYRELLGKVSFSISCRANLVTKQLVSLLKKLNVVSVAMGLESGCNRVLKTLKYGASVEQNAEALRLFKDAGIQANAFFLIGGPDETEAEIHQTYHFIKTNAVGFFDVSLLQPLPGTPLWNYALEQNLVSTTMDWGRLRIDGRGNMTKAVILSKELSREDLQRLHRKFMRLRLYNILKTLPRTPWLSFLPRIAWLAISEKFARLLRRALTFLGTINIAAARLSARASMIKRKGAIPFSDAIPGATPNRLKHAHFPYLADALQEEKAQSREGLRIVDVGCGPGDLAVFCRSIEKCHWIGIDLWHHQLRQATEKRVYEYVVQGNLLDGLPLKDESIDVVICSEVLMYLPNVPYVLAEFFRVMRTGAKLFAYEPISCCPRMASALKRWGRQIYHESGSVAFNGSADWRTASRPSRISYHSFKGLIREIELLNLHVVHVAGFRIFRNRIRFLNGLEKYAWYGRMTKHLVTRYPQISSELMVVALKGG